MTRMSFSGCVSERGGDLRNAVNTAALDEAVRRFPTLLQQSVIFGPRRDLFACTFDFHCLLARYAHQVCIEYWLIVGKEAYK